MVRSMKTVILPLWEPNGVKSAALEETEHLFGRIVSFYVPVLFAEPSLWEKVPRRDEKTHALVCDPETGEILMRKPKADDVLTRAEALTFVTQAHPAPPYDLASVPGASEAPTRSPPLDRSWQRPRKQRKPKPRSPDWRIRALVGVYG